MKVLTWNLNHRAARRPLPEWIGAAITVQSPDVVVLTEYVEGPDHADFLDTLAASRLTTVSLTERRGGENQLLVASRADHRHCQLQIPDIHPSVPSNALEILLGDPVITVLGFRMPAFTGRHRVHKRETWDWLLGESDCLRSGPAIIVGDFNTAPADSVARCGDCLEELVRRGWRHARPGSGFSWRSRTGTERQIDHLFLSRFLSARSVAYVWDFEVLVPEALRGRVGLPDHAMLIAEIEDAGAQAVQTARRTSPSRT